MVLKNGKFYDADGNVVPLEHGNKEQFAILERHRKRREAFERDGFDLTVNIETKASVAFPCVCGEYYIGMDNEDDSELDATEGLVGKKERCPKCKQQYVLEQDGAGDIIAKFAK